MKNPQTVAENLYQQFPTLKLKSIKDNACCVFTFMWCMYLDPDDADAIITVGKMIDKGVLDQECTVYWNKVCEYLTGRSVSVQFVDIKDPKEVKKIKARTPVYYERTYLDSEGRKRKKGHWVGVENGKIAFNSLKESLSVKEGTPVKMRVLTFLGDICQKK